MRGLSQAMERRRRSRSWVTKGNFPQRTVAPRVANGYSSRVAHGIDAFLDFLKAEQARGVTHVPLDAGARQALRALHERVSRPPQAVRAAACDAPPRPADAAPLVEVGTGGKRERIDRLRARAADWQPARQLGTLREPVVFSTGDPDARLVLVGEAPGYEEEKQGEPFVGPAGKKLDDILKAMGLSRDAVYITNIVKNRPAMARQATNNRKPTQEEMRAWLPIIRAELDVLKPDCIIALGATAAEGLLGGGQGVGAMRGKWHEFDGVPVRVTYHPSYLLRTEGQLAPKRQLWEDMLAVMERLAMPISQKQRGFFQSKE